MQAWDDATGRATDSLVQPDQARTCFEVRLHHALHTLARCNNNARRALIPEAMISTVLCVDSRKTKKRLCRGSGSAMRNMTHKIVACGVSTAERGSLTPVHVHIARGAQGRRKSCFNAQVHTSVAMAQRAQPHSARCWDAHDCSHKTANVRSKKW